MSRDDVLREVERFGCKMVEVTGGEPLAQAEVIPLMRDLLELGYRVLLETSGSLPIHRVPAGVCRIVDIKCPGSGEVARNHWENLHELGPGDELKFVIADREDYDWAARQLVERDLVGRCPVLFSPVHGVLPGGELARWVLDDGLPVRVQVQLHKVLWPEVHRGV
jgi:7-carboxy-7-deazaguanine synthase